MNLAKNNSKNCKEVKEEIDSLTNLRTVATNRLEKQISLLMSFQEVEYQVISMSE